MNAEQPPRTVGPDWPVNQLLRRYPVTAPVLNRFAIDTCCGGTATLEQAAIRDGVDAEALLEALNEVIREQA